MDCPDNSNSLLDLPVCDSHFLLVYPGPISLTISCYSHLNVPVGAFQGSKDGDIGSESVAGWAVAENDLRVFGREPHASTASTNVSTLSQPCQILMLGQTRDTSFPLRSEIERVLVRGDIGNRRTIKEPTKLRDHSSPHSATHFNSLIPLLSFCAGVHHRGNK
jgi:hypothetical protein